MAKFPEGFNANDHLISKLSCPSCTKYMKPPIYKCGSDHPICNKCWVANEKCMCGEVYKAELKQEYFDGYKLYDYQCTNKCTNVIMFIGQWSFVHRVSGTVDEPYEFKCGQCAQLSGSLYRYNGVLLPEEKFLQLKVNFKPPRDFSLEHLTSLVLYQCEMEGCDEYVTLAEQKNHEANCVYRVVACPYTDCKWKGPVLSLVPHCGDISVHESGAVFDPMSQKPLSFEFAAVQPTNDQINDGYSQLNKVFLYNVAVKAVISVTMRIPESCDKPLQLNVEHIGLKSVSDILSCKICLKSKVPREFHTLGIVAQNDIEAEKEREWKSLPSMPDLEKGGFVEGVGADAKIIVKVMIQQEKAAGIEPLPETPVAEVADLDESLNSLDLENDSDLSIEEAY